MNMKHALKYLICPAAAFLSLIAGSCERAQTGGDVPGRVSVRFVIDGPVRTRVGEVPAEDEQNIGRWALLVFDMDGRRVAEGVSSDDSGISTELDSGVYTACAVVNVPSAGGRPFSPADYDSLEDLESAAVMLEENSPSSLMMYGKQSLSLSGGDNGTKSITVRRLVSKVGVRAVRVDDSGVLAGRTVILSAIYLSNVPGMSSLGEDLPSGLLPDDASLWHNRLGQRDGSVLLVDGDLGIEVSSSTPYAVPHYFYPFPNATSSEEDSNGPSWSRRCSRLVFEAKVDGVTYYYPVTIPAMERNRTYIIGQAVIKRLGSTVPEGDCGSAMDVEWTVGGPADWDGTTPVEELS